MEEEICTVRARRFLTSSRPNFQTFCTLAVRKSLLRVAQRGKRTRRQPLTHGSLDPEETKGRYIPPLRFPLFATPSTLVPSSPSLPPSLRTKTLPNSIATLCSLGPETRAPLFAFNFRHPFSGERNL